MQEKFIIVLSNVPNSEIAHAIACNLVVARLAACVNILPGVQSVYRWQGKVEEAQEVTMLIKTRLSCYAAVEALITTQHPYDVPEILRLPIEDGLPAYLAWVAESTQQTSD